ncbi:MFS transporter [Proteinivorax hydrogeniformans]|uniref:MFS transporter n=1 Tax=Proteinivorax hydrogeniformans TaxID=1826727 RepID=A0AAU8HV32_9FIRM
MTQLLHNFSCDVRGVGRNIHLYLTASFFAYLGMGAGNVLINLYLMNMGFNEDFVGIFLSVKLISTGVLAIPSGIITKKMGYKWSLKLALLLVGAGILLLTYFPITEIVLLSALLWGLGLSFFAVSAPPFLQENCPPRLRQQAFSYNFSVMMISMMFGNLFSGLMVENLGYTIDINYRITLTFFAVITLLGLIPLTFIKENLILEKTKFSRQIEDIKRVVVDNKSIGKLLLCHGMIGFGAGLIVPLFNVFLQESAGASEGQIGTILALSQTSTAVAGLLTPWIVPKLGKIKTVTYLRMASIPFLILIASGNSLYFVGLAFIFRGSLMNMTHPVELEFSMQLVNKEQRPSLSALLKTVESSTRAFSVVLGGFLMSNVSYTISYYLTCSLYLITAVLFYYWFKNKEGLQKVVDNKSVNV